MKKLFYSILVLISVFSVSQVVTAQQLKLNKNEIQASKKTEINKLLAGTYTFSYSTGTYSDLVGGTNLSAGMIWDDPELPCPIGFDFKFFNVIFDSVWVSDPWQVAFGTDLGNGYDYYITPYGADLMDRAFGDGSTKPKSPISYLLTDTAPNRILKIEWKNAAFLAEQDSHVTRTNYINLQLWLYETTNNIEIHWGPHYLTYQNLIYPDMTGPYIGLNNDKGIKYYTLTGDSTKPTMIPQPEGNINGTPPNGMIYKFDAGYVNGIKPSNESSILLYPNPVSNFLNIRMPESNNLTTVTVYSTIGTELMSMQFANKSILNLNLASLPNGVYVVKVQNEKFCISEKITKR